MENVVYTKLELKPKETPPGQPQHQRPTTLDHLGQAMHEAGQEFGPDTVYGGTLLKVAGTELKLGAVCSVLIRLEFKKK
jgi:hypothetical protein